MKKEIVPANWKESLEELRRDIGETVERWLSRLKPEIPTPSPPPARA